MWKPIASEEKRIWVNSSTNDKLISKVKQNGLYLFNLSSTEKLNIINQMSGNGFEIYQRAISKEFCLYDIMHGSFIMEGDGSLDVLTYNLINSN